MKKCKAFNLKQTLEEVCEIGKYKAGLSQNKFKYNLNFAKQENKSLYFTKMVQEERLKAQLAKQQDKIENHSLLS